MTFYLTPFLTYRAVGYWSNYRFLQRVRVARNAYRCTIIAIPFTSVIFRYCVQTNEDTIVRFSASGRTITLVSGEVKFIRNSGYSQGITPVGALKWGTLYRRPWMTLNGVMAIMLHYFAEYGSFHGQLRKSDWLAINEFLPINVIKYTN